MSDSPPIWRTALNDSSHPLYQAAWLIFSRMINLELADKWLADKQEIVLPFLYEILDTDELYLEESLGSGNAPINAVELLGHWQITDAIPRLMKIFKDEDWETIVHDRAIVALGNMGAAVRDPLFEYAAECEDDREMQVTIAGVLADAVKNDDIVFGYIENLFHSAEDEHEILYMAENMLENDPETASVILENLIKGRHYRKHVRERLQRYVNDKRAELDSAQHDD